MIPVIINAVVSCSIVRDRFTNCISVSEEFPRSGLFVITTLFGLSSTVFPVAFDQLKVKHIQKGRVDKKEILYKYLFTAKIQKAFYLPC